ncbi:MAG: hypothetical protein IKZ68_01855, partial [Bacilli bacterium]|nr:hypothetical protein [Bacilli bacterium]
MNKKLLVVSLAMGSICLAGCSQPPIETSGSTPNTEASSIASASIEEKPADITNADLPLGVTTYTAADGTTHNLNRSSVYKVSGVPHVNSRPEDGKKQKLLVNPIRFTKDGNDKRDTIVADDALLEKINKTFTASDEELKRLSGSEIFSVQSFYERSSFGKGAFDVVVLPCWVDYDGTPTQFQNDCELAREGGGEHASNYLKS